MTIGQALIAYSIAAGLLTVTPGLDTALVLRTAAVEGSRSAALAAIGIVSGCMIWGAAVALGLGALFAASQLAFTVLKWLGAIYLLWLGLKMLTRPRSSFTSGGAPGADIPQVNAALRRGLLTNLLNPKVGVFYVSFLPQFLPAHVSPAPFILLLAAIHALMGIAWFIAVILATRPIAKALQHPGLISKLDRTTGVVFVGFGIKLALARR